jgi:hypothetical protein
VTAKKEQALSITFSQSDWFIFSLRDMLASAPFCLESHLPRHINQSDCEITGNCGKKICF